MEVKLEDVCKSYNRGKTYAVQNVSVTLTPGVYGLLGPNGAGKSTLINMITDNLIPERGRITMDGKEIHTLGADYRGRLGYMPQQQGLYETFTGETFLWYMSALKGMKKAQAQAAIEELLNVVNLKRDRYKKLKSYSGGMKQRILIAQAMLNNPDILILDEPTAGLDPKERIRIRNFISENAKNKIVLLATHVVSDIEYVSKEILLMREGNIIRKGSPQELLGELDNKVFEVLVTPEEEQHYQKLGYKIANVSLTTDRVCLRIVSNKIPTIGDVRVVRPCLEDVYLYWVE